jgi:hypothetical protein
MKSLCLLAAFLCPVLLFAAAQTPEKLRFDGMEEQLMATPLESFWTEQNPKPESLSQTSLACWRGYVGTWELIDKKLYLIKLERHEIRPKDETFVEHTEILPLEKIVGQEGPVPATWFSGVLRVARGEVITQVNAGFASVYDEDVYFIVEKGIITAQRTIKNDPTLVTSDADLAWRELTRISSTGGVRAVLPEEAVEAEQGNWLGQPELLARAEELAKSKATFEVRGIRFPGKLWFPNRTGADAFYPLDTGGLKNLPSSGVAIEATCTLVKTDDCYCLVASEIIELPPGLAIQRSTIASHAAPANNSPRLAGGNEGQ